MQERYNPTKPNLPLELWHKILHSLDEHSVIRGWVSLARTSFWFYKELMPDVHNLCVQALSDLEIVEFIGSILPSPSVPPHKFDEMTHFDGFYRTNQGRVYRVGSKPMGSSLKLKVEASEYAPIYEPPQRLQGLPYVKKIAMGHVDNDKSSVLYCLDLSGRVWLLEDQNATSILSRDKKGSGKPMLIEGAPEIVDIAAAKQHCLLLDKKGQVWKVGMEEYREVGFGLPDAVDNLSLRQIEGLPTISRIVTDKGYSLFLDINNNVFVCGASACSGIGEPGQSFIARPRCVTQSEFSRLSRQIIVEWFGNIYTHYRGDDMGDIILRIGVHELNGKGKDYVSTTFPKVIFRFSNVTLSPHLERFLTSMIKQHQQLLYSHVLQAIPSSILLDLAQLQNNHGESCYSYALDVLNPYKIKRMVVALKGGHYLDCIERLEKSPWYVCGFKSSILHKVSIEALYQLAQLDRPYSKNCYDMCCHKIPLVYYSLVNYLPIIAGLWRSPHNENSKLASSVILHVFDDKIVDQDPFPIILKLNEEDITKRAFIDAFIRILSVYQYLSAEHKKDKYTLTPTQKVWQEDFIHLLCKLSSKAISSQEELKSYLESNEKQFAHHSPTFFNVLHLSTNYNDRRNQLSSYPYDFSILCEVASIFKLSLEQYTSNNNQTVKQLKTLLTAPQPEHALSPNLAK